MSLELLRIVWWLILGMLLAGFAVTKGADLGTAALLPFVARDDFERQRIIDCTKPARDAKPVWFIMNGLVALAAWPALLVASLSGFYLAALMVFVALLLRPVGFEYRRRFSGKHWDAALTFAGIAPPFVFGAAFGNLLLGVPFNMHAGLHPDLVLLRFLSPFPSLCGLTSLTMTMMHGAAWINLKCRGAIQTQARYALGVMAFSFIILSLFTGLWAGTLDGYWLQNADPNAPSFATTGVVLIIRHGWQHNFWAAPILWLLPAGSQVAALLAASLCGRPLRAFVMSAGAQVLAIATAGTALFPFLLPSSSAPEFSLTLWNASSGKLALEVVLGALLLLILCERISHSS